MKYFMWESDSVWEESMILKMQVTICPNPDAHTGHPNAAHSNENEARTHRRTPKHAHKHTHTAVIPMQHRIANEAHTHTHSSMHIHTQTSMATAQI